MTDTPNVDAMIAALHKHGYEIRPIEAAASATPAEALDVEAMTETLRYLYHADQPCDRPDEHRHDHMARGIVGQYPRVRSLAPQQGARP